VGGSSPLFVAGVGIAIDRNGNLLIGNGSRIRRIAPDGLLSTVAGEGSWGFGGDGGPAIRAKLREVTSIATDAGGNVYFSDVWDYRVRKVSAADGVIDTVAGTWENRSPPPQKAAGSNQSKSGVELKHPGGVAVDGDGNLFIADTGNNRILKVSVSGETTTVAGSEALGPGKQVNRPRALALDRAGNLFFVEDVNLPVRIQFEVGERIRRLARDGTLTTVAGSGLRGYGGDGGRATEARLNGPRGITVDAAGNLFIADTLNHRVRMVTVDGRITTVAGTGIAGFDGDEGPAASAQLVRPAGVAVDADGNLFIREDGDNWLIRKVVFSAQTQ
jgi:DNA-binding beta-propeller fold protein YncE